jgi:hypothetical protein
MPLVHVGPYFWRTRRFARMKRPISAITFILLALALATPPAQAAKPTAPFVPDEVLIQFRDGTTDTQHQAARDRAKAAKKDKMRAQPNNAAKLELAGLPAGTDGGRCDRCP